MDGFLSGQWGVSHGVGILEGFRSLRDPWAWLEPLLSPPCRRRRIFRVEGEQARLFLTSAGVGRLALDPFSQKHSTQILEVLQHPEPRALAAVSRTKARMFGHSTDSQRNLVWHQAEDALIIWCVTPRAAPSGSP